ncbi:DegQ family serine endoprotease [Roseomonas sp. M0104]|uniref:Probable periplasmic serine endoprotease DegP-like n=1 Tax=Teichococcus coralli TaxID=2545983 RepID=A0A845B9W0_9PROT|nr:DegQ family serine endoprotease [Pseudoroseomonas coralli]MXP64403.1 DegQ family serine endoprotease [Pseudoroseomonas coralli]
MSNPTNRRRSAAFAAFLLAGTALGGGAGWLAAPTHAEAQVQTQGGQAQGSQVQQNASAQLSAPQVALPGFGDLVARVKPAVVTITATERVEAEPFRSPFPEGSPQDRMFRRYFGAPEGSRPQAAQALGSGFIIDAGGDIVTNNHVVDGASSVKVTLDDGRELSAKVVGRDPRTDLALLKVEAGDKLPFLNLGNSDKARPGDWVVALGNPYGLGGTVTAGIVSARGRDIHSGPYDDFLQIDAPINRGNSGGPLFGLDGSVIGVNTAIFSPSGGSIGIGFAIPSNLVKTVVTQLKESGHVERGFLGVTTQPVDATMAEALNLKNADGALVAQVQPNSPAAEAGIKAGDVVTAVGGTRVSGPRDLARLIASMAPGTSTELTTRRGGGDQKQVEVKLATLQDGKAKAGQQAGDEGSERGRIGIGLASVEEAGRAGLDLPQGTEGAVVAQVRPGSPAAEAGLQTGDVILGVGDRAVKGPEQAASAIREAGSGGKGAVALRVLRDGQQIFVAVRAGQANKG